MLWANLWRSALLGPASLGLTCAYALQGEATKTRAKCQDFLTLWKDTEPDVPREAAIAFAEVRFPNMSLRSSPHRSKLGCREPGQSSGGLESKTTQTETAHRAGLYGLRFH
jgi:hypothetical protein